jgi:hypothetical protein
MYHSVRIPLPALAYPVIGMVRAAGCFRCLSICYCLPCFMSPGAIPVQVSVALSFAVYSMARNLNTNPDVQ